MNQRFTDLIVAAIKQRLSDLHITGGFPLIFRKDGALHFDKNIKWSHTEIDEIVRSMLSDRQLQTLRKRWSVDFSLSFNNVRARVNTFHTTRGLSMAIRLLPETIPDLASLNLHPSLSQIAHLQSGFVLVCGSTGSGKSTTIAAIIEEINRTRAAHVITIEDPIEYRFKPKKSFIEQREVGIHVPSFDQGLLDVLRESPDVIFVGELREPETIRLTLNAAESGHLVFATLHASDAEDAAYRINNCVTGENQDVIRYQFASTISWLIVQQLHFVKNIEFRVPVLSILKATPSVQSTIRDNKLTQLENIMVTSKNEGMFTMKQYEKEFIGTHSSFVPPYKSFGMGAQSSKEKDHISALIDPNAIQDVIYMSSIEDASSKDSSVRRFPDDEEQRYLILEDHDNMDLKDLLAKYEEAEEEKANKNKKK
ncbi:MAG TPA: PilT/PilU family type 4a pilus ATPase [Deltaproteobacteria bacterium]|nr:PilT/PilU family type 4a pilus ATPase [Deltaproteobacteria bacterium]